MKERLKYYLRGLGTGIVVTMILMMVSNANAAQGTTGELLDEQQEEQTMELVYREKETSTQESVPVVERESTVETVAETVIEIEPETKMVSETVVEVVEIEESAEILQETKSEETESVPVSEEAKEPETTSEEDTAGQQTVDTTLTIQVVKGDGSGTVARKLQNAGLIDNASEFDAYLMQHGYDKKIRIGTVKIEAGSTWMEIAEKLSGK